MTNKNKLPLIASIFGASALVAGSLAFFYTSSSKTVSSNIGPMAIKADGEIIHTQINKTKMYDFSHDMNYDFGALAENVGATNAEEFATKAFSPAPDNLNPGDNFSSSQKVTPGTDHEIHINIKNEGNKSIKTRVIVNVSGTKDGKPLSSQALSLLSLYIDKYPTVSGYSAVSNAIPPNNPRLSFANKYSNPELTIPKDSISFILSDENTKKVIPSFVAKHEDILAELGVNPICIPNNPVLFDTDMVLSGVGENAEIERYATGLGAPNFSYSDIPNEGNVVINIGLSPYAGYSATGEQSEAKQEDLFGAELKFNIKVQAIQNRNTKTQSAKEWKTVFEKDIVIN